MLSSIVGKGGPPAGFQTGLISPIFTTGTNFLGFESFFTFEDFLAFLIALGSVLTSSALTYPFLAQNDIPGAFLVSTSDCPGALIEWRNAFVRDVAYVAVVLRALRAKSRDAQGY